MPKLGRLPNSGRPRVKLTADLIPAAQFTPPPSVDYYSRVPAQTWGMDGNDKIGDCTCAELDHTIKARQIAAGNTEISSTEAEVVAIYSAVTGYTPSNPASDQGAEMQAVRDYWRKNGVTLGGRQDKVTLFAQVDHTRLDLVRWCVDRLGAVALGINFPASAMQQFDAGQPWTVVQGSQIEGGHAISMVGFDPQYAYVVTWGKVQAMTWDFFVSYVEEAWTDLSTDFCNAVNGDDPFGETLYELGQQYAAVTGQANPFPAPAPTPTPPPTPPPQPTPNAFPADTYEQFRTVAGAWIQHHYSAPRTRAMLDDTKALLTAVDDWLMRS